MFNVSATFSHGATVPFPNLRQHVAYSGVIRIGRDFIDELYAHAGHHPTYKYREAHELIFRDGELTDTRDISEEMEQYRQEHLQATGDASEKPEKRSFWRRLFGG